MTNGNLKRFVTLLALMICSSIPVLAQISTAKVTGGTVEGVVKDGIASLDHDLRQDTEREAASEPRKTPGLRCLLCKAQGGSKGQKVVSGRAQSCGSDDSLSMLFRHAVASEDRP
jgi:hypothetical protein